MGLIPRPVPMRLLQATRTDTRFNIVVGAVGKREAANEDQDFHWSSIVRTGARVGPGARSCMVFDFEVFGCCRVLR